MYNFLQRVQLIQSITLVEVQSKTTLFGSDKGLMLKMSTRIIVHGVLHTHTIFQLTIHCIARGWQLPSEVGGLSYNQGLTAQNVIKQNSD